MELYQDRAAAFEGLGRLKEAVADLHRSRDAAATAALSEHQLAAAVFSGAAQARAFIESNQALQRELLFQMQQTKQGMLIRRLAFGLAGAAIFGVLLLLYFLYLSRRHRRTLQQNAALLDSLAHNLTDTVVLIDMAHCVLYANRPPLGQRTVAPGSALCASLPEEVRPAFEQAIGEVFTSHRPLVFEVSCAGEDGAGRHYEQQLTPVLDGDRPVGVTIRSTDVTELRRREWLFAQADQRSAARVSGNLEQGLAQELAGIALLLQAAYANGKADQLSKMGGYLTEAIKTTRELARAISPMQASGGSLDAALRQLVRESAVRLGVSITPSIGLMNQEPDVVSAEQICRAAEEALNHLTRVAPGAAIQFRVDALNAQLQLALTAATGIGTAVPFDLESPELRIIRYRVRLLGGTCHFEPRDAALTVVIRVPLPKF